MSGDSGNVGVQRVCLRRRRYLQSGNLIAVTTQDLELEAVKGEALSRFGDGAGFMDHETGDCRGFIVGQSPAKLSIKVADRCRAVHDVGTIGLWTDAAAKRALMLVRYIAENLVENIFARDETLQCAVFVDNKREMRAALAERR